ncbi:metal-binding protein [Nodosilinea sp. P-1105]|uniref:metal-binding protein n=1 Tax=Nodosilinea sp. P-1105 TaxID=2546229 RepID=UPI00146ED97C|nr:metal-binding protein [Nodosilinea sp. P-1105]NMF85666.1 metal-binding protein [Nodosilinea sp. P-1105]
MSSGRTHDRITLWTLPLVVLVAFRITLDGWLTVVVCLGFLLGGWVLGPDLDIHSVQYKRWGWLRWIWLPYRGSMRHRSRWSHGPIIGTTVRVLYVSVWLALAGLVVVDVLNHAGRTALTWGDLLRGIGWGMQTYWPWWLALVAGLELGALSHYGADWLSSRTKRRKRRTVNPRAKGRGQRAKGRGQKAKGRRQRAKGKRH